MEFGPHAYGTSLAASMSRSGRYIAFRAENLDDPNGRWDIFVYDALTGTTRRATSTPTAADAGSAGQVVSGAGRFVVFHSLASDLVQGDTNGSWDIFVRDLRRSTTLSITVPTTATTIRRAAEPY